MTPTIRTPKAMRPAWSSRLVALILPAVLFALWALGSAAGIFGTLIPSPRQVVEVFIEWSTGATGSGSRYYSGTWTADLLGSFFRATIGFALGAVISLALGLLVGWSHRAHALLDPTIHMLRAIPRTALLPFAIIFLGLGNAPALAMVAFGAFAQMYVQVVVGVQLVPRDLKRAAYMLGASHRQVLMRVVVPHALPSIFAGLRLGIVYSWTMLILAEMFAVGTGFGYTLWRAYEFLQVDLLIASLLMITLAGWLSDRLILFIMARKLRWASAIADTRL